jgi:hypothetical protein
VDVGTGGGIVTIDGAAIPRYPYTLDVASGTTIVIEAIPAFGRVFDSWGGDLSPQATNPTTMAVDCNRNISAAFSPDWLLFGTGICCLVLVIFLGLVLVLRRRAD